MPNESSATRKKKPFRFAELSDDPQQIDRENWFYEERRGALVVHEVRTTGGEYIRTDQILIPWRRLTESLERRKKAGAL